MPKIQLDMFEVGLGAAILLQFNTETGPVRVLADAGVGRGFEADHVLKKLKAHLKEWGELRIDLLIGTHYDEDHLKGLVPVIEDTSIEIGEAWMPPVANDTLAYPLDQPVKAGDLLSEQFQGEDGDGVLEAYLASKWRDCQTTKALENPEVSADNWKSFSGLADGSRNLRSEDLSYFRAQLDGAEDPDGDDHGVPDIDAEHDFEVYLKASHKFTWDPFWPSDTIEDQFKFAKMVRDAEPKVGAAQARSLAAIRRSAAEKAINATSLHAVVQALSKRKIPIRSKIIDDGEPQRYRWNSDKRRFMVANPLLNGLTFDLLGPSRSLVKKHRDILPVAEATKVALAFRSEIKSITPSNQLSYIGRFGFAGQGILIAGDAGCVDFSVKRGVYFPKLLGAMLPLQIIQVAHHGGNNAHFYRVLNEAKYPAQTESSLLLLSHAFHDKTRPSPEFENFLLGTLRDGDDVKLLFTSEPTADKVVDYIHAIHAPVGTTAGTGNVQIVFDDAKWKVTQHAVKVARP